MQNRESVPSEPRSPLGLRIAEIHKVVGNELAIHRLWLSGRGDAFRHGWRACSRYVFAALPSFALF